MTNKRRVHLWAPDIFGRKGGIGVFSSFLLRAIREWDESAKCRIIIKHDRAVSGKREAGSSGKREAGSGKREAEGTTREITKQRSEISQTKFSFAGRWPRAFRTPAYAVKLFGWAATERPDLIIATHLHFTPAANLIRKLGNIPFWTIAHGIEAWEIKDHRLRHALRHADRILAVSNFTRVHLLNEQQLSPDRISLLPNTVDQHQFRITDKPDQLLRRYGISREQPVILTVARLVRSDSYKGYASVLRAMPAIRKVIPNVHYVLVGTGDDKARVERIIDDLGLKDSVTLTGYVNDSELGAHYNLCDVFAMPSKREGFGIVYLEAMACGKPTLGGNKDGAVDALMNGELGALVDPDDPIEIATTLIAILKKQYPLPLMYEPEKLRARVLELYGYERFRSLVASHLDEFFSAHKATARIAPAIVN